MQRSARFSKQKLRKDPVQRAFYKGVRGGQVVLPRGRCKKRAAKGQLQPGGTNWAKEKLRSLSSLDRKIRRNLKARCEFVLEEQKGRVGL